MSWFSSFDDEYVELLAHLTEHWQMKPSYATTFLLAYKKSIGKMLSEGKRKASQLRSSPSPEAQLFAAAFIDDHDFALVGQAYKAYMADLRRGRHVGTQIERAIWAILAKRSDLLEDLDRGLANYIDENWSKEFPTLFEDVYSADEGPSGTQTSERVVLVRTSCDGRLRVPRGMSGKIRCPVCKALFEAST